MAVQEAVKYANMTDEQIVAIKRRIETFVKSQEFFDKYANHIKFDRGTKTMKSRRVVRPIVKKEEIAVATEDVAPRPQKIVVETFQHSVDVYRDKIGYTAEDVLFGYDDIVKIAGDTLAEIGVQKLDLIKGKPFFESKATYTYATSCIATLSKVAIVLDKNKAKPWQNGRYLCLTTPEIIEQIRSELLSSSTNGIFSDATKEEVDKGIIGHYGRWDFAVDTNERFYKNSSTQYMVCLGRRPNGESPIDIATIDGVEVIHNPLGSGVLVDADGNYTSDDNKQRGSVAININGLGAYVNDDLCVIDVEVSVNEIGKSVINEAGKTGFVSLSYADVGVTLTAGTNTSLALESDETREDSSNNLYGARNTVIKCTVSADAGKTLGTIDATKWSVTANKGVAIVGHSSDYKSVYVQLSNGAEAFAITCTATAS